MHSKMFNRVVFFFLWWLMQMLLFIFKDVIIFFVQLISHRNIQLSFFSSQYHLATKWDVFLQRSKGNVSERDSKYMIKCIHVFLRKNIASGEKKWMTSRLINYRSKSIHRFFYRWYYRYVKHNRCNSASLL